MRIHHRTLHLRYKARQFRCYSQHRPVIMARRIENQKLRKSSVTIIGEGVTEQFYFTHIRTILGYHFTIKPYYFSVTTLVEVDKKIAESVQDGGYAIAVFDADVQTLQ